MKLHGSIIMVLVVSFCFSCSENSLPIPDFTYLPKNGNLKTIFYFDASMTADNESQLVAMMFRWDWTSDGKWDTDYSNSPYGNYRFSDYGTYKVTLEVIDGFGGSATVTKELSISQQDSMQDPRDKQWYKITVIGGQVWMAENLNIGVVINKKEEQKNNQIIEKYCYSTLNNPNESACSKYGGLYQWEEAMQYSSSEGTQGICPPDWHISTDMEWQELMDNFYNPRQPGGYPIIGSPFYPDTSIIFDEYKAFGAGKYLMGANSPSGFDGIYVGYRNPSGEFDYSHYYFLGYTTGWWSSTKTGNYAYRCGMLQINDSPERFPENIKYGFYIRCLKNNE